MTSLFHQMLRVIGYGAAGMALGLRMPGHGTAPSGLVELAWQDMAAAVRLAVQHLADQAEGRPLYLVGYSTGAALAVNYVLAALDDERLPKVDRVAMLSPAIGVKPAAALAGIDQLIKDLPNAAVKALHKEADRPYRLSVVGSAGPDSRAVVMRSSGGGEHAVDQTALELSWPDDVYSLAHVSLPFSPKDPVYGTDPETRSPGIQLVGIALRGERGVLQVSAADILRLRSNPLYPFVMQRVMAFFNLDNWHGKASNESAAGGQPRA